MITLDPVTYSVGWGTLSLLNAGLARCMYRSGLGWWLLSLLLGPIATFLLALNGPLELGHTRVPRDRPAG